MIKKDKMPGVCKAILIGIAAYSNLMTMDVQAANNTEDDNNAVPTEEKDDETVSSEESHRETTVIEKVKDMETGKEREVSHTSYDNKDDYDSQVKDIVSDIPIEHETPSEGQSFTNVKDEETGTETTTTKNTYTWTDEDGAYHERVVETIDTNGKETTTTVVTPETTVENKYEEPKLDGLDEDGNEVYITGETVTTGAVTETTTNDNDSSITHVTETVTTTTTTTQTVYVTDENGEKVTQIDADAGKIYAYDADGNKLVQVLSDKDGNPIVPEAFYDEQGNKIDVVQLKNDEDGNLVFWDEENLVKYTVEIKGITDQYGYPVYVNPITGEKTLDATTTTPSGEDTRVDLTEWEEGCYTETVETGKTHWEECDGSHEGDREVISKDIIYVDGDEIPEGATALDPVLCGKDDVGAYLDKTVTETTTEQKGLYDDDKELSEIKDLLGDYGITGQEISLKEAQTNINAGKITSSNNQTGVNGGVTYNPDYTGEDGQERDEQGSTMRIEDIEQGVKFNFKGNVSQVILGSESLKSQLGYLGETVGKGLDSNAIIDTEKSVESIRSEVADKAEVLLKKDSGVTSYEVDSAHSAIDFSQLKNESSEKYDVVYANTSLLTYAYELKGSLNSGVYEWMFNDDFKAKTGYDAYNLSSDDAKQAYADYVEEKGYGSYELVKKENASTTALLKGFDQTESMGITMNDDQVIVFNVDTSKIDSSYEIDLNKFSINVIGDTTYKSDSADGKLITQKIVFNFGSFSGTIKTVSSIIGTIIAPNATFVNASTSVGQVVCDKYQDASGEWHYSGNYTWTDKVTDTSEVYKRIPYEVQTVSYEHEVAETKEVYYKLVPENTVVPNIPIHAVITKQYEYKTEEITNTEVNTTQNEYYLEWATVDKSVSIGGDTSIEYNKVTVEPPTEEPPVEEPPVEEPPEEEPPVVEPPVEEPPVVEPPVVEPPVVEPPVVEPPVVEPPVVEPPVVEPPTTITSVLYDAPEPPVEPVVPAETIETVELADESVPLAAAPKTIELIDEDVPLAALPMVSSPKTGDNAFYGMVGGFGLALVSAVAGACVLLLSKKKK